MRCGYFQRGCRGKLKLITVGSEGVNIWSPKQFQYQLTRFVYIWGLRVSPWVDGWFVTNKICPHDSTHTKLVIASHYIRVCWISLFGSIKCTTYFPLWLSPPTATRFGWTQWSDWTPCDDDCYRTRERYCYHNGDIKSCKSAQISNVYGVDREKVKCPKSICPGECTALVRRYQVL